MVGSISQSHNISTTTTTTGAQSLIQSDISLANYTSFRVGGSAEFYAAPTTWEETLACFEWYDSHSNQFPLTLIGAGSNLLISDKGIPGLVLNTHKLRYHHTQDDEGIMVASAGEPIARLAWNAARKGWRGLEWAVGIPGTTGGSVVMNAGAHQRCIADSLLWIKVLEPSGSIKILKTEDLAYQYRTSNLQGKNTLVLEAAFQLETGFDKVDVRADTTRNLLHRKSTQPYHLPSCGSVFRNPYPHAAGRLIEGLGLKGYQIGGAQIAQRHANFILNCGEAKAMDILRLIYHIQEKVEEKWAIALHPEVKILGEFSNC